MQLPKRPDSVGRSRERTSSGTPEYGNKVYTHRYMPPVCTGCFCTLDGNKRHCSKPQLRLPRLSKRPPQVGGVGPRRKGVPIAAIEAGSMGRMYPCLARLTIQAVLADDTLWKTTRTSLPPHFPSPRKDVCSPPTS